MSREIKLEVVTPDRKVLSDDVEYVGAPGVMGEFGVLPGHIPFLSAIGVGSLYYKKNGKRYYIFVSGGFCEVSGEKVSVLAEAAEKAEEIDIERARKARERSEDRLRQHQEEIDYVRARAAMVRSLARLQCRESAKMAGTCQS